MNTGLISKLIEAGAWPGKAERGAIHSEIEAAREEGRKEGKAEALAIIRARISDLASINDHWAPHHFRALREIAKEIEAEE